MECLQRYAAPLFHPHIPNFFNLKESKAQRSAPHGLREHPEAPGYPHTHLIVPTGDYFFELQLVNSIRSNYYNQEGAGG